MWHHSIPPKPHFSLLGEKWTASRLLYRVDDVLSILSRLHLHYSLSRFKAAVLSTTELQLPLNPLFNSHWQHGSPPSSCAKPFENCTLSIPHLRPLPKYLPGGRCSVLTSGNRALSRHRYPSRHTTFQCLCEWVSCVLWTITMGPVVITLREELPQYSSDQSR